MGQVSTEATEVPFDETAVEVDRLLELFSNYGGCRDRRTRNNAADRNASKAFCCRTGLSDTHSV